MTPKNLFPKLGPNSLSCTRFVENAVGSRRDWFKVAGATAAAAGFAVVAPQKSNGYVLPDLPYAYEALEPAIDTPTMK